MTMRQAEPDDAAAIAALVRSIGPMRCQSLPAAA